MTSLASLLETEWSALTDALGVTRAASRAAFADLCRRYSEPSRAYHTLAHVAQMLQTVESWRELGEVKDWDALRLGIWFHDAVYDSRAADNEAQSAKLARERLTTWGIAEETQAAVGRLILATKTHTPEGQDQDGALLLDADLAILGRSPAEYDCYRRAIRDEFAWVSEDTYCDGRARVLRGFLERPRIYHTHIAQDAWEENARRNLSVEIERLLSR